MLKSFLKPHSHLMYFNRPPSSKKYLKKLALTLGAIGSCCALSGTINQEALGSPSMMEFRWEDTGAYKKLYYYQSSKTPRDRATYYLVMKPFNRKTAILKLTINVPKHFNSRINPKKLSLCRIQIGGMLERTKCLEKLPAVFEVNKEQTTIEVFPNQPIPVDKKGYAVVMKVFNPTQAGMFQFNAMSQSPGDLPVSRYIGSWSIDIR